MSAAATPGLLPDHILNAIFILAKRELKENRFAFRGHDFDLQQIFHNITQNGNYPVLKPFVFADRGPEPYSPVLSESVSRLQLAGLIGRENPDYEVLFLRSAGERFFDEVLTSRLTESDLQQLRQIASQFVKKVKVVKSVA